MNVLVVDFHDVKLKSSLVVDAWDKSAQSVQVSIDPSHSAIFVRRVQFSSRVHKVVAMVPSSSVTILRSSPRMSCGRRTSISSPSVEKLSQRTCLSFPAALVKVAGKDGSARRERGALHLCTKKQAFSFSPPPSPSPSEAQFSIGKIPVSGSSSTLASRLGSTPSTPSGLLLSKKRTTMLDPSKAPTLEKQGYELVGSHSAVKMCRWTKNSLKNRGQCYKHTFYGIASHRCMEMTPSLACANKCVFCWRNHTNPVATHWKKSWETDDPEWLAAEAVERHETKFVRQVISGKPRTLSAERSREAISVSAGRGLEGLGEVVREAALGDEGDVVGPHVRLEAETSEIGAEHTIFDATTSDARQAFLRNAPGVRHCALSLVGEPVLYPHLPEFLQKLYRRGISTFVVTNGQFPDQLADLPDRYTTQLYVSVDASNEAALKKIGRPLFPDAWERLRRSLSLLKQKKCRTVCRLTYLKNVGAGGGGPDAAAEFAALLKLSEADFVEVKGATFAPQVFDKCGLTVANVPTYAEVRAWAGDLCDALNARTWSDGGSAEIQYAVASEHYHSCAVLLARADRWYQPLLRIPCRSEEVSHVDRVWRTWIDFSNLDSGNTKTDLALRTPDWALPEAAERGLDPEDQPRQSLRPRPV